MRLADHPTVRRAREREDSAPVSRFISAEELRALCLEAGADDAGVVPIDRPALAGERPHAEAALPGVRTFVSFVVRMNRDAIRSPARSAANLEFHHTVDEVEEVARRVVRALNERGGRAMNGAVGFPMEADRWPGRMWIVSHKVVAVEAGLGRIGLHRNVIHPKYGNFVLLGTVLTDLEVTEGTRPISFDPCLSCKLCVAACPVGAVHSDGGFDFSACYTHNYREFMGGFVDWVNGLVESESASEYRRRTSDAETVSMWQSLSFGPNYKAAYCLAVCPAGDDVIAPFLENRAGFLETVVRPLQRKQETLYVLPGSDAEAFATERHPHKRVKRVSNGLRPSSIEGLLRGLPLSFQQRKSKGLDAVYHFVFTGREACEATITIRDQTIRVEPGIAGTPSVRVTVDSDAWLRIVNAETTVLAALLGRKLRVRGPAALLRAFSACFP